MGVAVAVTVAVAFTVTPRTGLFSVVPNYLPHHVRTPPNDAQSQHERQRGEERREWARGVHDARRSNTTTLQLARRQAGEV
jgi:hypothetical protein